jgi:hypothetical protein
MLRYWQWHSSQRQSGEDGNIDTAVGKENGVTKSLDNKANMRDTGDALPVTFI